MEFTKARLSDSMYCPLGPGSDEEVREGTPNIGAYHCPNPMDYVIQGGTHGGWDRKKAGFASASFELPQQSRSLPQGAKREFLSSGRGGASFEPDTSTARSFSAAVPGLDLQGGGNSLLALG